MRQSNLFISSTSPLTSFTVLGTGALIPRYRYVTPPPFSVRMRQSLHFSYFPLACFAVPGTGAPMSRCLGSGM